MTSRAHQRLRDATRADHERLEARLAILPRIADPRRRRALALGFWRLHDDIERAAAPWLQALPGLDFEARRRTQVLRADLAALGLRIPPPQDALSAGSRAEALGLLYVAEGSSLGGQVIRREVMAASGDFEGLGFLDPYGTTTGRRWREFLDVIDRASDAAGATAAMVRGALAGFRHAELRLTEEPVLA